MACDAEPSMFYVADTSVLIDLVRDRYPESRFRNTVWARISALLEEGRLMTPREVFNELSVYEGDIVFQWLKDRPKLIRDIDEAQAEAVTRILAKAPELVNSKKLKPFHADPWVVALALVEDHKAYLFPRRTAVLTQENGTNSAKKIPVCCKLFGICCLSLLEMFERESWDFVTTQPGSWVHSRYDAC